MCVRSVLGIAVVFALLAIGARTPALAQQTAEPAAKSERVTIPVSQLRFYCFSGANIYSVGAITCLSKGRWGVCKWSDNGSITGVPQGRAYWENSVAPSGA